MPWIGLEDGEKVIPEAVETGTWVECPECGQDMSPRGPFADGRARHFAHRPGRSPGCSGTGGGESDLHRKWKNHAVSRLKQAFEGNIEICAPEYELAAPESPSHDRRFADAFVAFKQPDPILGDGLIIEVQHRNVAKDISATTADYLAQNYAVSWLDEGDFAEDRCKLLESDLRVRAYLVAWPEHVPDYDSESDNSMTYRDLQSDLLRQIRSGDWRAGASATLPPDWFDTQARRLWQSNPWHTYFETTQKGPSHGTPGSGYPSDEFLDPIREATQSCSIYIEGWEWIPEQIVRAWVNQGLEKYNTTHSRIPPSHKWSGSFELSVQYTDPEVPIKFPPDLLDEMKDELREIWSVYANAEYTTVRPLSSNSADRYCEDCQNPADYYLRAPGIESGFFCSDCVHIEMEPPSE